jgi:hypothetical protein
VKSLNSNDTHVIKLGKYIELEPDVLLNGTIYTDMYKLKPAQENFEKQKTQNLRQKEQIIEKKTF